MKLDSIVFDSAEVKMPGMPVTNIDVNIDIPTIAEQNGVIAVNFKYTATYVADKKNGVIGLNGIARFSGPELIKTYKTWVKDKKLSGELGEKMLSTINYSVAINSVFIAKVFNLRPPITPPMIKLAKSKK